MVAADVVDLRRAGLLCPVAGASSKLPSTFSLVRACVGTKVGEGDKNKNKVIDGRG